VCGVGPWMELLIGGMKTWGARPVVGWVGVRRCAAVETVRLLEGRGVIEVRSHVHVSSKALVVSLRGFRTHLCRRLKL
jgi:GTP-sensing pleiotropic transcriptional regulator CodY